MHRAIKNILIIFPGSLGDFIAFLPALKLLRKEYPLANIDIACNRNYAPLVERKPLNVNVHERLSFALSGFFASPSACTGRTRDYLEKLDLILSYIDDDKKIFSENLRENTTGKVIVWKGNIREGIKINIYRHYLNSLDLIGIDILSPEYGIDIFDDEANEGICADKRLKSIKNHFCIHPGSGSKSKNWNIKKYIELAEIIENEYSLSPVFFTGEADEKIKGKIPGRYNVFHNEDLLKVASIIKSGKFYIGNDSGISHLAGCLRVKSFVIFGPTVPEIWATPVENVFVIDGGREKGRNADCLNGLEIEKVFAIIQNNV